MNKTLVGVLTATAVLVPAAGALAAQDGSTGGAAAPTRSASSDNHKKIKLPKELKKIAMCESGGNPRAISPSGKYRGKYQFDIPTWKSIGGHGDPAKASEYEQDKRALKLYHQRGTSPWPNCA